jgi:SnoaL-like domain
VPDVRGFRGSIVPRYPPCVPSDVDLLVRIRAERDIRDVLARYCRGIDRVDMELVRACYHPDARDEHGSFDGTVEDYIAWVSRLLAKYDGTTHLLGQSCFDWIDAHSVLVETYGQSHHWSASDEPSLNLTTGFRFVDRFEERGGEWRIAHRVAFADWSRRNPPESRWDIPDNQRRARRDRSDPAYGI